MHSKKDLADVFKALKLTTPEKRRRFERMGAAGLEGEQTETYLFIRAGSSSSRLELEGKEDAKLEDNS